MLTFLLVPVSDEEVGQVEAEGEDNRQEAPSRYTHVKKSTKKSQSDIPETISNSRTSRKNYDDTTIKQ